MPRVSKRKNYTRLKNKSVKRNTSRKNRSLKKNISRKNRSVKRNTSKKLNRKSRNLRRKNLKGGMNEGRPSNNIPVYCKNKYEELKKKKNYNLKDLYIYNKEAKMEGGLCENIYYKNPDLEFELIKENGETQLANDQEPNNYNRLDGDDIFDRLSSEPRSNHQVKFFETELGIKLDQETKDKQEREKESLYAKPGFKLAPNPNYESLEQVQKKKKKKKKNI
jgi:hypothetical protein